jgi:hypothetical protein
MNVWRKSGLPPIVKPRIEQMGKSPQRARNWVYSANVMKYIYPRSQTLRETLSFVAASDITAPHKNVLIEILTHALTNAQRRVTAPPGRQTKRS